MKKIITILLFLVAFVANSQNKVYFVSTSGDDSNDGLSWLAPFRNLQTALDIAVSGDQIWVAQGTYYPDEGTGQSPDERTSTFTLTDGVNIYGGFKGVNGAAIPRDTKLYPTILSGDLDQNDGANATGNNSFHVVTGASNAILDGFTIQNGLADGTGTNQNRGGGIFNGTMSPMIQNCIVRNNAGNIGGGMYNGNSSTTIVKNTNFILNSCNAGGAVYNDNANTNFINCRFMENSAPQGGAIYNTGSSPNSFTNCIIAGNLATQEGGGIYNIGTPLNLTNCTITGNNATIEAGGLYLENTNLGVIQNSIIWNNMANNATNLVSATLTETNSVINFANSLVDNYTPESQAGGTTGVLSNGSPDFIQNLAPSMAPISGGNFRLGLNSVALNVGNNSLNSEIKDILGNPRIQDTTIDLGAIEGATSRVYHVSITNGNDSNDGLSWSTAFKNLQSAIAIATNGDEIWVEKGTYYPDTGTGQTDNDRASTFLLKDEVKLYGGFLGNELELSERDSNANETILSGDLDQNDSGTPSGMNAYHVVSNGSTFSEQTTLDGFTIKAGLADGTSATDKKGAGIYLNSCTVTIINCKISGNNASNEGGGIYVESSLPKIYFCEITGNTASNGGGIFNIFDSETDVQDCLFSGNTAVSGAGATNLQALPKYKNCVFELNTATVSGGGMLNDTASGDITNTIFRGNSASNGAGMYNINFASPIITNCLFTGNKSSSTGGGMDNSVDAAPSIVNATFSGNSAVSDGGGIYNAGVNITIANSIFWNNEASGVTNTASASVSENNSSTTTFTTSLVENLAGQSGVISIADPTFVGGINPNTAPNTSGNFRLLTNSIALDVGTNSSNTQTMDLDGNTRVQNTTIDLGPYEGATTITTWQSTSSTDWTLGANWSNGAPNAGISVLIPSAAAVQPEIDAGITYEVKNLTIETGTFMTLKKDAFFTVNGNISGSGQLVVNSGGSVIVKGTSSIAFIYKRTIGTTNEYWVSSPVAGQDIDNFAANHPFANGTGASDLFFRDFDMTTQTWNYYQNGATASGNIQQGTGRSIQLTASSDLTFNGTFPVSDVSVPITSTVNGYAFLGNPFPSSIAANAPTSQAADIISVNKNILAQQTIWLYNATLGIYEAVNQASPSRYIPVGQGFFVITNGVGSLKFQESMQSHQTDVFARSVNNTASIVLTMTNGANTKKSTIAYRSDATAELDAGLDSSVFDLFSSGSSFDFYTQLVENNFGRKIEIQSLPDSNYETMVIPIGFKGSNGETIEITADVTSLPAGYNVFIEDKNDNSFTSIKDMGEKFSTTLTTDVDGAGRLFLHVTQSALSIEETTVDNHTIHMFLKSNDYLHVSGIEQGQKALLKVFSITGQEIFNTRFLGENSNELHLPRLRTGLYIVHIYTEKGRFVKKVLKH